MITSTARQPYICSSCLRQSSRIFRGRRRPYSTTDNDGRAHPTSPPPPPPPSGASKLTNRRLIALHGQEAPKFLQGIITNNVNPTSQTGFYAAFLTAPGKVLQDAFIYPTLGSTFHSDVLAKDGKGVEDPGYLVECDAGEIEVLLKHLKRHKLRSKFTLRLVDQGELEVWGAWREDERWTAHSQGSFDGEGTLGLTDCRAPGMGRRVLLRPAKGWPVTLDGLEEAPLTAYTIRRYLRGVPEGQQEIPRDDSLPMNYNIDVMGGIDFKKGCYTGQELTIRTHHTGVVRRRVLPIALYDHGTEPPDKLEYDSSRAVALPDTDLDIRRGDKRKRSTGKFIAGVGNIGLGLCRLEQMSDLVISGEGSSFKAEDTFEVQSGDGAQVGVKAFVPAWMRGRIREPKIQRRME